MRSDLLHARLHVILFVYVPYVALASCCMDMGWMDMGWIAGVI